jgi:hypothetical protein
MSRILDALIDRYNAQISEAKATLEIYLNKSVGSRPLVTSYRSYL